MFRKQFDVLVVDDEPDVLMVTKMALRNVSVYGVPVRVHTAASMTKAVEILSTTLSTRSTAISLASVLLVDVVMESDHAGLELCQHVRESWGNRVSQIYIRTGQPGTAPERSVIDRHDISGYVAKGDASEEKLYSMVKSGVRQYLWSCVSLSLFNAIRELSLAADSRKDMITTIEHLTHSLLDGDKGKNAGLELALVYLDAQGPVAGHWPGESELAAVEAGRLRESEPRKLGMTDRCFLDGNSFLIDVAATKSAPAFSFLARGTAPMPDFLIPLHHSFTRSFAALWHRAR